MCSDWVLSDGRVGCGLEWDEETYGNVLGVCEVECE